MAESAEEHVFESNHTSKKYLTLAIVLIAVGTLAGASLLVVFLLAVLGSIVLPKLFFTLCTIPIWCLFRGIVSLYQLRRIAIMQDGISAASFVHQKHIQWDRIAHIETRKLKAAWGRQPSQPIAVILKDSKRMVLLFVVKEFPDVEQLVDVIRARASGAALKER